MYEFVLTEVGIRIDGCKSRRSSQAESITSGDGGFIQFPLHS